MSNLDLQDKIARVLSDILSDKFDAKVTIKFKEIGGLDNGETGRSA